MASSSKGSSFLAFHGKKYDPTFDWHDDDGLLQDPRTHALYCHVDTMISFFFFFFFSLGSLLGKNVVAYFIESFMARYFHLVILKILGHCMIGYVGECWLWSILKVLFFL